MAASACSAAALAPVSTASWAKPQACTALRRLLPRMAAWISRNTVAATASVRSTGRSSRYRPNATAMSSATITTSAESPAPNRPGAPAMLLAVAVGSSGTISDMRTKNSAKMPLTTTQVPDAGEPGGALRGARGVHGDAFDRRSLSHLSCTARQRRRCEIPVALRLFAGCVRLREHRGRPIGDNGRRASALGNTWWCRSVCLVACTPPTRDARSPRAGQAPGRARGAGAVDRRGRPSDTYRRTGLGAEPPRTVNKALQAHVARLRSALGRDTITGVGAANRLDLPADAIDAALQAAAGRRRHRWRARRVGRNTADRPRRGRLQRDDRRSRRAAPRGGRDPDATPGRRRSGRRRGAAHRADDREPVPRAVVGAADDRATRSGAGCATTSGSSRGHTRASWSPRS